MMNTKTEACQSSFIQEEKENEIMDMLTTLAQSVLQPIPFESISLLCWMVSIESLKIVHYVHVKYFPEWEQSTLLFFTQQLVFRLLKTLCFPNEHQQTCIEESFLYIETEFPSIFQHLLHSCAFGRPSSPTLHT